MAAIFPGAVVTQAQLWTAVNGISTTLNGAIDNLVTTIPVIDTTNFPATGYFVVDQEVIKYTGKTGVAFTGCTRGADSSTAASHLTASVAAAYLIADHHNIVTLEIAAIEQNLSDRFGLSSTQAIHPAGTVLLPSVAVRAANMGLYSSTANELDITVNGTAVMSLDTSIITILGVDLVCNVSTRTLGRNAQRWGTLFVAPGDASNASISIRNQNDGLYSANNQEVNMLINGVGIMGWKTNNIDIYKDVLPNTATDLGSNAKQFGSLYLSVALTNSATSNQIVLGVTRTVTITAPTPASTSRTWTIPDISGAGTFAALEGTQTFSGAKTHSATLTMSGATIAMGSQKITGLANGTVSTDAAAYGQLKVIQVVYASSTTAFSTTSNTFQTSNLTASITPTSASNRVLVIISGCLRSAAIGTGSAFATIARAGTNLGSATGFTGITSSLVGNLNVPVTMSHIDSPASTSSLAYDCRIRNDDSSTSVTFGNVGTQTIILMEVV